MKRNVAPALLICLITLALVTCDNGTIPEVLGPAASYDDFQGGWVYSESNYQSSYSFTDNTFSYQDSSGNRRSGTFTFTENEITFIPLQANTWMEYTRGYQISGQTLVITGPYAQSREAYTKQAQHIFVAADPTKGFNYGYFYYIPDSIRRGSGTFLLVEPNNSGMFVFNTSFSIDDSHIHEEAAYILMGNARSMADELGVVLIIPAIPRPRMAPPNIEPQILNRASMQASSGTHARVDLQLIGMIDDLREICRGMGINLEQKFLMNGFSASGTFANRFTALHPGLVQAVVSGGVTSNPIIPIATARNIANTDDLPLIYPVGIADIQEITGTAFNAALYRSIPQFIYIGAIDTNDPVNDAGLYHGILERDTVLNVLGSPLMNRYERAMSFFNAQNSNVTFRTYQGVGHDVTPQIRSDIIAFLRANIR